MKRKVTLFGLIAGGLLLTVISINQLNGQGPAGTPPARKDPPRVAVFNVAKVMKDFARWQYYANLMNGERERSAQKLTSMRDTIANLQEKAKVAPEAQKDQYVKQLVEQQRLFEDEQRKIQKQIDADSTKHLRELFGMIQQAVNAIAEANGYDIVFAYPEATTADEMNTSLYIDLKMRPPAAMPFYVSKSVDVSDVLVKTLNTHFPAPSSPNLTPAGGGK